jgi:hypothetical protein
MIEMIERVDFEMKKSIKLNQEPSSWEHDFPKRVHAP